MKAIKLQVTKPTENEVNEVQEFLRLLSEQLQEKPHYSEAEYQQKITRIAETLPSSAWLVPFTCSILLQNFQDKESPIIAMPKWITEMHNVISQMEHYLSSNKLNTIEPGSHFHLVLKDIVLKQK